MAACLLDNIFVNVGHFFILELQEFKVHDESFLIIPSVIIELCRQAGVEEFKRDNWVELSVPIFPQKKQGKGTFTKNKKRKIYFRKSSQVETNSCRSLSMKLFEVLIGEFWMV